MQIETKTILTDLDKLTAINNDARVLFFVVFCISTLYFVRSTRCIAKC